MRSPERGWGWAASSRSTSATVASTRERQCAQADTVAASSSLVTTMRPAASFASSSTSCPSSSRNRSAATTEGRVRLVARGPASRRLASPAVNEAPKAAERTGGRGPQETKSETTGEEPKTQSTIGGGGYRTPPEAELRPEAPNDAAEHEPDQSK